MKTEFYKCPINTIEKFVLRRIIADKPYHVDSPRRILTWWFVFPSWIIWEIFHSVFTHAKLEFYMAWKPAWSTMQRPRSQSKLKIFPLLHHVYSRLFSVEKRRLEKDPLLNKNLQSFVAANGRQI